MAVATGKSIATSCSGDLEQARRYFDSEGLRAAVLQRVLSSLPTGSLELVIIGHSLGSLVAIDLLDHLSHDVHVRRLVTIGSPAALPGIHDKGERLLKRFPYGRVESWMNAISPGDPVSAGRGLSSVFPAAQDVRIGLALGEHDHGAYLRHSCVAAAIGEAVQGSLTNEMAIRSNDLDARPTDAESTVLFALAYAHLVKTRLQADDDERGARYSSALAIVQNEIYHRLAALGASQSRGLAAEVKRLADHAYVPPVPRIWQGNLDAAADRLITAATTNLIQPYDVDADETPLEVLESAAVGLGFGADQGRQVRDAIEAAREGLSDNGGIPWGHILLGAAGLALVAAAPVLLPALVPAGLAGGAAITSALAAFGPGGMVGGIVLAGGMGAAGAGAATASVVSLLADAGPAVLEVEVLRRCARAEARKRLGLGRDLRDWQFLVALESEIAQQFGIHAKISDDDSPSVKGLRNKRDVIRRAIRWMVDRDLAAPGIDQ